MSASYFDAPRTLSRDPAFISWIQTASTAASNNAGTGKQGHHLCLDQYALAWNDLELYRHGSNTAASASDGRVCNS